MANWFTDRRQEFIAASLNQFGQIRRSDLMQEFGITQAQASNDISEFMATRPGNCRYDVSAKTYVVDRPSELPMHRAPNVIKILDQNGDEVGEQRNRSDHVEAFRDEKGTVWVPPTAYAYAQVCKANDRKRELLVRVEEFLDGIVNDVNEELNMSNYNEDDVASLNNEYVRISNVAHELLKELKL